jgi:cell division septum initiation protein DivIVA
MSAPITDAHRRLAQSINGRWCSYDEGAQLIADSEAKAVVEIAMVAVESADRNVSLRLERDQLRAEVERLKKQIKDDNRSYGCELRDPNGTIWEQATKDRARAERAEAGLATERARLDDLVADINDACITLASAKDDCDDYAMQNTEFKLTAVCDVLLQYIPNAAMKKDAK